MLKLASAMPVWLLLTHNVLHFQQHSHAVSADITVTVEVTYSTVNVILVKIHFHKLADIGHE